MIYVSRLKNRHIQLILGLVLIDLIYFSNTSATQATPYIIFLGFLLIIATLYVLINAFMKLLSVYGLKLKQINKFSILMSIFLTSLLALQSIGELSIKDFLVLLPLTLIAYIYSSYGKKANRQIE